MSELPQGWELQTLSAIATWSSGGTPKSGTTAYYGGGIPWAVIGDLNDATVVSTAATVTEAGLANSSAKVVEAGTVLVAMYGSIGKLGIAGTSMATNQAIACAVPSDAVDRRWLFWWLRSQRAELLGAGKGGTQANISQTVLKAWPIPVAPLGEQERIVTAVEEAFSKLDAGEAGLRTARRLLKRMREAVLAAAVTGRLVPQDPADTPATKLLVDLGVEPAPGMFDVPAAWSWAPLGALLREPLRNGMSAVKADSSIGLPTFSITAVTTGDFSAANIKYTVGDWGRAEELWAAPGDLFVQRSNTPELVGTARLYRGTPKSAIFPDLLIRVRSVPELRPEWLEVFMASPVCRAIVRRQAKGLAGSMPKIAQPVLERLVVPVAPEGEQDRIVNEVDRQLSVIEACERAVDTGLARSAALRRSVLKAAFEGRLVPQDSSDEPASVLLERVQAERAAADRSGGGRRRKKLEAS